MEKETKELIKKTIDELLEKMGFTGKVTVSESSEDDSIICNITTDVDSHFLIGQHGINLQAIQHLARLMVRKQIPEKIRFILDVNDYRQQKNQSVIEQAIQAAQEAVSSHCSVAMKPMSTYERRLAHLELSKDTRVSTESVGEGEDRKIMVRPADLMD
ncbi:MAG: Single-stranded nucleic acid binding R3H domain protein [Candidatus Moranbacteria bacterium GW2011_GWC2_37_8]|nr:MAG: Single-stranded nucleic acid binding R3H domain protein [Candidatus Moranbacteria bacterium GW2011_GWC2_37_8]KKQ60948.1 MAG: Single-stranded nucleic acid binding R3H domain protein [Parcubacteria group bacterium GW2011_GWC1_38_22]KKQ80127.1 MAG: Single-stranded nucleic acid binding R3H domain protein [Candidatus Moranbacteria bacterium GW2011_GWD2_38_7]